MALDDFAPAAELNGRAEESHLDEDLFDFPLTASLEVEPGPKGTPRVIDHGVYEESVAEVPAPAPAPAPAPTPVPEPALAAATAAPGITAGTGPELDEDLFGFPSGDPPEEPVKSPEQNLERGLDQAAVAVTDLLEDDLGEMAEQTHQEELLVQAAAASTASTAPPTPPAASQPVVAPATAPVVAHATPPAPASDFNPTTPVRPFTVPAGDPRIPWALTGAVVVFMLGVLAIAWRATSNLGSSGVPIGEAAGEGTAGGNLGDGNAAQQQLLILEEILRQQKLATQAALGAVVMDGPPRMQRPHHITLAIAQESIDEKRFAEARSSLYGMLATSDLLSGEDRSQVEEAAAFLLAQSYRLEAAAEQGEER